MNYDRIIDATFDWFSLKKVFWFLVFFWLSVPVLVLVPLAIDAQFFSASVLWIVIALYDVMYLAVLLGFLVLTIHCLEGKRIGYKPLSLTRVVDTVFLVIAELWFIFVWNMHRTYRIPQLLLLIGMPLMYYYLLTGRPSLLIFACFVLFAVLYLLMAIYSCIRFSFSVFSFYSKDLSIVGAVKQSWALTHKKTLHVFYSIALIVCLAAVIFIFISIVLGAVTHLVLLQFFNPPVAYSLALKVATLFALAPALIAYYFAFTELYSQLLKEHESSTKIKRFLARRTFGYKPSKAKKERYEREALKKATRRRIRLKKKRRMR